MESIGVWGCGLNRRGNSYPFPQYARTRTMYNMGCMANWSQVSLHTSLTDGIERFEWMFTWNYAWINLAHERCLPAWPGNNLYYCWFDPKMDQQKCYFKIAECMCNPNIVTLHYLSAEYQVMYVKIHWIVLHTEWNIDSLLQPFDLVKYFTLQFSYCLQLDLFWQLLLIAQLDCEQINCCRQVLGH